jgi:hypothetical protein
LETFPCPRIALDLGPVTVTAHLLEYLEAIGGVQVLRFVPTDYAQRDKRALWRHRWTASSLRSYKFHFSLAMLEAKARDIM